MSSGSQDVERGLATWLATQIDGATALTIEGLDRVEVGHSAEMLLVTIVWQASGEEHRQEAVVRLRPPSPGLLEPYDLELQVRVLRALEATPVLTPRALFVDTTGDVLGRPFFIMDRLPGDVYERSVPAEVRDDPGRTRRMSESFADQIAAIHNVDLDATGLGTLGDGGTYLDRELDRWHGEIRRVARGPLPALERLHDALREQQPEPTQRITLVHGDAKPGNFAFVGADVSAVFDWEMADLGDPMADVGYTEVMWLSPTFTSLDASLTADEFVARWEQRTGLQAHHRPWYRAFQCFKLSAILLVAGWLFDAGHTDDLRLLEMTIAIPLLTALGLGELGVIEALDNGPYGVRPERLAEVDGAAAIVSGPGLGSMG